MKNYKDTYELYQSVLDEVHAPDDLKQRIKEMDTKHNRFNVIKLIPAVAACVAAVMVFVVILGSFSEKGNAFVLKASAAEIGGESFAEIAKVAPVAGEIGGGDGGRTENDIFPFSVRCDGRNIKSVKYSIENAVFLFPYDSYAYDYRDEYPNQASASDKITDKIESDNKIESTVENDKQYSSYTVSFDDQIYTEFNNNLSEMDKFPIQLMTTISSDDVTLSEEAKTAFEHLDSDGSITDEAFLNELMNDVRVVYNEMLSRVKITAEVTYEDGSNDSTSLQLSCLSADMQNGIVIGAKTV